MCGIAGFIGAGDVNILKKMVSSIAYRGPDEQGFWVKNQVGFGHARLSIVDLSSTGSQPMSNPAGTITIVFNGEIYNFIELRERILKTGKYVFRGTSDTEVIIYLYEEMGELALAELNGMFALAIYDAREQKMILARDRMGKKPLYYADTSKSFLFASEIKSLQAHPDCPKELDIESAQAFFSSGYVPTPRSIFKGIKKVKPASFLVVKNGTIAEKEFWHLNFTKQNVSFHEAVTTLDHTIEEATKRRLVADVPVGIFLSGGLDSSTIAYYAQKNSAQKIKTFSIGFEEASFDESKYAKRVAAYLGTDHYNKVVTGAEAAAACAEIFSKLDEPIADPSIIPTYLLSQFTREKVTVALGGDGGDELMAGYQTFEAERLAQMYAKLPQCVRKKLIEKIIALLPASDSYFSLEFKARKFVSGFDGPPEYRHQRWLSIFSHSDQRKLFKPEVWNTIKTQKEFGLFDQYHQKNIAQYDQIIHEYLRTYLMDDVLVKVDRASMWASLEVRAPLLDYTVVDYCNSLPYYFKKRGRTSKFILKKIMKDKLPKEIIYRKKKGFGIPLAAWLRGSLKTIMDESLSREKIDQTGLFNFDYIATLTAEHCAKKKDHSRELWSLMVFINWYHTFNAD